MPFKLILSRVGKYKSHYYQLGGRKLEHNFWHIDVFTTQPYTGNPAAVVTEAEDFTNEQMQKIAQEVNLPETVFVSSSLRASFRLRFFTPAQELNLAGHPTIAAFYALMDEGSLSSAEGTHTLAQETSAGILPVKIQIAEEQAPKIVLTLPKPQFMAIYKDIAIALALGVEEKELIKDCPIQTVSCGLPQLMVTVKKLATLEKLKPDATQVTKLARHGDFSSIHVFSLETYDNQSDTHARHFVPMGERIIEDAVTGTASGAMAAYCLKYGLTDKRYLTAEQGHIMGRPGKVEIEIASVDKEIEAVKIGGKAVIVIRGKIKIP